MQFSDFFEFKSIQQCWVNLVCQTQIINGVYRPIQQITNISSSSVSKFNEKKMYPETLKPSLNCYLYHNFFFSLSILLSRFKQSKLYFPVYYTPFSSMSTFACIIWCSCPPNSERDMSDTQSRYANRKSYITMNCQRAFQSIAIFHTSSVGLQYLLVFTCFSFFILIELVTKRNRYICVSICLIDIGSLLMPISRTRLFTF